MNTTLIDFTSDRQNNISVKNNLITLKKKFSAEKVKAAAEAEAEIKLMNLIEFLYKLILNNFITFLIHLN